MFSGVPLYPVEMMRLSSTMMAPTRLPLQLARRRTASAMFMKYLLRFSRASRAAWGSLRPITREPSLSIGVGEAAGCSFVGKVCPSCLAISAPRLEGRILRLCMVRTQMSATFRAWVAAGPTCFHRDLRKQPLCRRVLLLARERTGLPFPALPCSPARNRPCAEKGIRDLRFDYRCGRLPLHFRLWPAGFVCRGSRGKRSAPSVCRGLDDQLKECLRSIRSRWIE